MLDADEDLAFPTLRQSSPSPSIPRFSSSTPFPGRTHRGHTTPPSSPRTLHGHTTPPSSSSSRVQRECTIPPPSSSHIQRVPSTESSRRTTPSSPRSEVGRDLLPPPQTRVRLPPAPFHQGYTPGAKPKASDYDEGVEKTLLNAMHEYACLILTTDAFPTEARQTKWAETTWRAACEDVGVHYECSVRMIRLVRLQHLLERSIDMV